MINPSQRKHSKSNMAMENSSFIEMLFPLKPPFI